MSVTPQNSPDDDFHHIGTESVGGLGNRGVAVFTTCAVMFAVGYAMLCFWLVTS